MDDNYMTVVDQLAKAVIELTKLRYDAWMVLQAYDKVALRPATRRALGPKMECLRADLPTDHVAPTTTLHVNADIPADAGRILIDQDTPREP